MDLRTVPIQVQMCVLILFWRLTPNRWRFPSFLVLVFATVLFWRCFSEGCKKWYDPAAEGWSAKQKILVCRKCKTDRGCTDKDPQLYHCVACEQKQGRSRYLLKDINNYSQKPTWTLRCTACKTARGAKWHLLRALQCFCFVTFVRECTTALANRECTSLYC